jgi:hypothetical protein
MSFIKFGQCLSFLNMNDVRLFSSIIFCTVIYPTIKVFCPIDALLSYLDKGRSHYETPHLRNKCKVIEWRHRKNQLKINVFFLMKCSLSIKTSHFLRLKPISSSISSISLRLQLRQELRWLNRQWRVFWLTFF